MPRTNPIERFKMRCRRHLLSPLLLLTVAGCSTTAPPTVTAPPATPQPPPVTDSPETAPETALETALERAIELYTAKEFKIAEPQLLSLRKTHPENARVALYLGRVYFATERYREAVDQFQHAVDLEGDVALHHLWLGRTLGEQVQQIPTLQRLPLARRLHATFLRAVELDPESAEAHLALARFYSEAPPFAGGDPAAAQRHAERLAELDPAAGHRLQGRWFERDKKFDEAEAAYRAAITADPEDAESYQRAGELFERQGHPELAREMFERARELEPGKPQYSNK